MSKAVSLFVVAIVCLTAVPSATATTYYIGRGDAAHAKVSFRVEGNSVKYGLLETKVRIDGPGPSGPVRAYDGFRRTPLGALQRFKKLKTKASADTRLKFVLAGRVDGSRASGRAKAKYKNDMFSSDTGKIRWRAKAVSWKRYERFSGFGNAVIHLRRSPGFGR